MDHSRTELVQYSDPHCKGYHIFGMAACHSSILSISAEINKLTLIWLASLLFQFPDYLSVSTEVGEDISFRKNSPGAGSGPGAAALVGYDGEEEASVDDFLGSEPKT